jgi:hypothetical protein
MLETLALVKAAGSLLEPTWDPTDSLGFTYRANGAPLHGENPVAALEDLANQDYLERVFVERLSACPTCHNHSVNVHESCLTCFSSNLKPFKALFHFRCGYVGPASAFAEEPDGRRCPKCRRLLKDLGTDHDSPGDYFMCRACTAMFQVPGVGARCVSCGARFFGSAVRTIESRDVFSYRLTSLGRVALDSQRPVDDAQEALRAGNMLRGRKAILEYFERARDLRKEKAIPFGAIVLVLEDGASATVTQNLVMTVRRTITDTFELGRLDSRYAVLLLPSGNASLTRAVLDRIRGLVAADGRPINAAIVSISNDEPIGDALDIAARRLDLGTS